MCARAEASRGPVFSADPLTEFTPAEPQLPEPFSSSARSVSAAAAGVGN